MKIVGKNTWTWSGKKRQIAAVLILTGAVTLGDITFQALGSSTADATTPGVEEITLPFGYRDWKVISVAHEGGKLNDIRAILGNDAAYKASRAGTIPFPDGAMIARLAWIDTASEENDKVFGNKQSFVAGSATNVQLLVKDSRKFAATGGWGFAQFGKDRPNTNEAVAKECFVCHKPAKSNDYVFTHYAP